MFGSRLLRCTSLKKFALTTVCLIGFIYEVQKWSAYSPSLYKNGEIQLLDKNYWSEPGKDFRQFNVHERKLRILAQFVDQKAYYNLDNIESTQEENGHHLQNFCKYPVLQAEDPSIKRHIVHNRTLTCNKVEPELVIFDQKTGNLKFDRQLAKKLFGPLIVKKLICKFLPFAGSLRPHITTITNVGEWKTFHDLDQVKIRHDHFQVTCSFNETDAKNSTKSTIVYRNAFAQVSDLSVENQKIKDSDEDTLSLDIVGLDSTSFNMFRRHMTRSWRFMKEKMGFLHLEGFNKVADNSMVNWVPKFLGKRYLNQSEDMLDELPRPADKPLDLDNLPWLWKEYKNKNCATMMNDDPMHFTRGLFHYPWTETLGFKSKPTDYYYRPWHVFHRQWPHDNASSFCFRNKPYYQLQLDLVERMIEKFAKKCHFSFSFFTDLTHDFTYNAELMDDTLADFLNRTFSTGYLNDTVLVIMGDHGNRISTIQYSYVGRIEERATFFSIYFPKWFKKKYPQLIRNFRRNKYRLTSNYDVHRMLKNIVDGNFDDQKPLDDSESKGTSLFLPISTERNCSEANIPENHCLCMEPSNSSHLLTENLKLTDHIRATILKHILLNLHTDLQRQCTKILTNQIRLRNLTTWTTSQMIQHGVRYPTGEYMTRLNKFIVGEIEYYETVFGVSENLDEFSALVRLQYDRIRKMLSINVTPLLLTKTCSMWVDAAIFCACASISSLHNDKR